MIRLNFSHSVIIAVAASVFLFTPARAESNFSFNAHDYGAVCNGSSHPMGADFATRINDMNTNHNTSYVIGDETDGFAIQAAYYDAAQTFTPQAASQGVFGATVLVPFGVCYATRTIKWASQVVMKGAGRLASQIVKLGDNGPLIQVGADAPQSAPASRESFVGFSDIAFNRVATDEFNNPIGQTVNNSAYLKFVGVANSYVNHVSFISTFEGIDIQGGTSIAIDDVTVDAKFNSDGTVNSSNVSTFGAHFGVHTELGTLGTPSTDQNGKPIVMGGNALPLPTWVRITNWTGGAKADIPGPADPSITVYKPYGPTYGIWITACEACSLKTSHYGHAQVADLMIEQGSNDATIVDNDFIGNYFDAAGVHSIGIYPHGVPGNLTHERGAARPGGSGANFIGNQRFTGGNINGSGVGAKGLYVDVALASSTSAYPIGVTSLLINGVQIGGHLGNCIELGQGVAIQIVSAQIKGCNYLNQTGSTGGILIGPGTRKTSVLSSSIGGDATGDNSSAAHQNFAIAVAPGASGIVLRDLDLSGNGYPLYLVPSDTQIQNVSAGPSVVTFTVNENDSKQTPPLAQTVMLAPTASLTNVLLAMPEAPYEGETVVVGITANPIFNLILTYVGGAGRIPTVSPASVGSVYIVRFVGGSWVRLN